MKALFQGFLRQSQQQVFSTVRETQSTYYSIKIIGSKAPTLCQIPSVIVT